jgi:hypothetical protein
MIFSVGVMRRLCRVLSASRAFRRAVWISTFSDGTGKAGGAPGRSERAGTLLAAKNSDIEFTSLEILSARSVILGSAIVVFCSRYWAKDLWKNEMVLKEGCH